MQEVAVLGQFEYVPARNQLVGFVERLGLIDVTLVAGSDASTGPICKVYTSAGRQVGSGQAMMTGCQQPYTLVDLEGHARVVLVAPAASGKILLLSLPTMTDTTQLFQINAETLDFAASPSPEGRAGAKADTNCRDVSPLRSITNIINATAPDLGADARWQ